MEACNLFSISPPHLELQCLSLNAQLSFQDNIKKVRGENFRMRRQYFSLDFIPHLQSVVFFRGDLKNSLFNLKIFIYMLCLNEEAMMPVVQTTLAG